MLKWEDNVNDEFGRTYKKATDVYFKSKKPQLRC